MVKSPQRSTRWMALAGLLAAACSQQDATGPVVPSFWETEPPPGAKVQVCKDASSPAGTYSFTISQSGGVAGTLLAGESFTLVPGECKDVWQALSDQFVTVTVTEVNLPAGVQFDHVVIAGVGTFTTPGVSVLVNLYHGAVITYFNIPAPPGGEGCTPGYWRNHYEDWPPTGYSTSDDFDTVFGVNLFSPNITLGQAIWLGGGGVNKLARHGTAGLLSAAHPDVNYPFTVAQVIAAVQSGNIDAIARANELGCQIP